MSSNSQSSAMPVSTATGNTMSETPKKRLSSMSKALKSIKKLARTLTAHDKQLLQDALGLPTAIPPHERAICETTPPNVGFSDTSEHFSREQQQQQQGQGGAGTSGGGVFEGSNTTGDSRTRPRNTRN